MGRGPTTKTGSTGGTAPATRFYKFQWELENFRERVVEVGAGPDAMMSRNRFRIELPEFTGAPERKYGDLIPRACAKLLQFDVKIGWKQNSDGHLTDVSIEQNTGQKISETLSASNEPGKETWRLRVSGPHRNPTLIFTGKEFKDFLDLETQDDDVIIWTCLKMVQ